MGQLFVWSGAYPSGAWCRSAGPIYKTRCITEAVLVIGVGQWIGITRHDPIQLDRSNGEIVVNVDIQTTTEGHGEGMLSSSSTNSSSARDDRFAQIGVAV